MVYLVEIQLSTVNHSDNRKTILRRDNHITQDMSPHRALGNINANI